MYVGRSVPFDLLRIWFVIPGYVPELSRGVCAIIGHVEEMLEMSLFVDGLPLTGLDFYWSQTTYIRFTCSCSLPFFA